MDSNVQPSFIPKKPLSQSLAKPPRNVSFFSLIATVIFVTVLILSGAVFGFGKYLERSIGNKQVALQTELNKFEPSLVADLTRLDARLNASKDILNKHVSLSAFFVALGNATLKSVRYLGFNYTAADGAPATIAIDGQAPSFTSVALQTLELQKPENIKYLKDASINNPNLDSKGSVAFQMLATVNTANILYKNTLKAQGVTVSSTTIQAASSTPATATSTATSSKSVSTSTKSSTH